MCVSCGGEIVVRSGAHAGKLRRHCESCRPPRLAKPKARKRRATSGLPFTVDHFVAWAHRLELDSGDRWVIEPFQEAFVADLFAGIEECWLVVPEGNGKSTLVSGLALYHAEHRSDGFVPVAAASREQAGIIYRQAQGFVDRNGLHSTFKCQQGYRRILCERTGSIIQVYAADAVTGDGLIPTFPIVDELHRHRNLDLYRTWVGKLGKRGGQIAVISTAGAPGEEFEETRDFIRKSATEVEKSETFTRAASEGIVLHEWAVPADGDVDDIELVCRANPFSGITVESLAKKRGRATMTLGHWRRFTCNLPTRTESAAIQEAEWYAARTDEVIPPGEPVWAGLDVAWKWDTTALVPLWFRDHEFRLLGPATILEPPRDGQSLDPYLVEQALLDANALNPLHTVVMDTSRAEQLASWIASELGAVVVDRPQSNAFAVTDYERWMEALRSGWLRHTGDPGLSRHALNAVARMLPGGDARFDRPRQARRASGQDTRVIDALTAASMVHSTLVAELAAPAKPAFVWRAF